MRGNEEHTVSGASDCYAMEVWGVGKLKIIVSIFAVNELYLTGFSLRSQRAEQGLKFGLKRELTMNKSEVMSMRDIVRLERREVWEGSNKNEGLLIDQKPLWLRVCEREREEEASEQS